MPALAFILWLTSLAISIAIIRAFMAREHLTAVAVLGMLTTLLHARSLIFFVGLDTPFPDEQFYEFWYLIAYAHAVGLFWIIIFTGSYTLLSRPAIAISSFLPSMNRPRGNNVIILVSIGVTLIGLASSAYLISIQDSISSFVYAVKVEKDMAGLYVIRQISILGSICCLIGLLISAEPVDDPSGRRLRRIPSGIAALFIFLIAINLSTNFMWGNRFNIAMFLAATAFAYHFYIRKISFAEFTVIVLVAAAGLQGLRVVRELVFEVGVSRDAMAIQMELVRTVSLSLHLAEFDGLMLALRDAGDKFDYRAGEDFWNGIVSWIPRQIWEAKPGTFHVGQWFRQVYEPERVNGWPVTVIGSWYVNFGYFGVVFGGLISGLFVAAVDRKYCDLRTNPWHAVLAPCFGFFLFDGGVNTGFPQNIVLYVVPLAMLIWLVRARSKGDLQSADRPTHSLTRGGPPVA